MADISPIIFRVCRKCGVSKPETIDFFESYKSPTGTFLRRSCRSCRGKHEGADRPLTRPRGLTDEQRIERQRARSRDYHRRHREEHIAKMRARRQADPERTRAEDRRNTIKNKAPGSDYQKRKYARQDKEATKAALKAWRTANPDKVRKLWERTYEKHKDKHLAKSLRWAREKRRSDPEYREKVYAKTRQWRAENNEWERAYARKKRDRSKDDPAFKILASIRARVLRALKGNAKTHSTSALLGAPMDAVRAHIETKFQDGMTWANWGRGWGGAREWHLDHVKPLATFDLTDPAQLAQACHFTNLQPLWAAENLRKGARDGWGQDRKSAC